VPEVLTGLAARLHAALPQTQCTRCGYPDCAAYAQAMAVGEAAINQCPPGGQEGVRRLAAITGKPEQALNPDFGQEGARHVAVIDEAWCIGCTLCLKACPTDAIIGANKLMHTVLPPYCTGCELCIPVCPVDCIQLNNVTGERTGWQAWSAHEAQQALTRYEFHKAKAQREALDTAARLEKKAETKLADLGAHSKHTDPQVLDSKRKIIEAALAKARAARQAG